MIIDVTDRFPLVDTTYRWKYDKADIDEDAIHHTATLFEADDLTPGQELAHLDVIYHYHVHYRGFGGIGYHGVSFKSGRRYRTAPWDRIGANVYSENDHLRGWAAAGYFHDRVPPQAQREGLAELMLEGSRDLGRDVAAVPHLKYGGTTCPGDRWREWVPRLPGLAQQMREEREMPSYPLKSIQKKTGGAVYATDGTYKWGITSGTLWNEMKAAGLVEPGQLTRVSDNLWQRIANRPTPLTAAQVRAALKAVLPAAGAPMDVDALAEAVVNKLAQRMQD